MLLRSKGDVQHLVRNRSQIDRALIMGLRVAENNVPGAFTPVLAKHSKSFSLRLVENPSNFRPAICQDSHSGRQRPAPGTCEGLAAHSPVVLVDLGSHAAELLVDANTGGSLATDELVMLSPGFAIASHLSRADSKPKVIRPLRACSRGGVGFTEN